MKNSIDALKVVFRADASVEIGTGHVMRCLTLAVELRNNGAICHFVTRRLTGHLGAVIKQHGFTISMLKSPIGTPPAGPPDHAAWAGVTWEQDQAETLAVIDYADWLIVDHYAFDTRWERCLYDRVGRLMVIDDLADRPHTADLLLDQNLGRVGTDYSRLVPIDCELLIGPHFALLRPEFANKRRTSALRYCAENVSHLMISMGGTDAPDVTSLVLLALAEAKLPQNLLISVVMGKNAPALARVRKLASTLPWETNVLVDVCDMAQLMDEADVAIGAGGGSTWERCCLGLPSIIIETASNQSGAVTAMEMRGSALGVCNISDQEFNQCLISKVEQIMEVETRKRLSQTSMALCAGDGAERVATMLEGFQSL